jgi:hypothetical protein
MLIDSAGIPRRTLDTGTGAHTARLNNSLAMAMLPISHKDFYMRFFLIWECLLKG